MHKNSLAACHCRAIFCFTATMIYFIIDLLNFLSNLLLASWDNSAARLAAASAACAFVAASAAVVCALAASADACLTEVSRPLTCDCKFSTSEVVAQADIRLKARVIIDNFITFFILFFLNLKLLLLSIVCLNASDIA
jgi:hypothetical protein